MAAAGTPYSQRRPGIATDPRQSTRFFAGSDVGRERVFTARQRTLNDVASATLTPLQTLHLATADGAVVAARSAVGKGT